MQYFLNYNLYFNDISSILCLKFFLNMCVHTTWKNGMNPIIQKTNISLFEDGSILSKQELSIALVFSFF